MSALFEPFKLKDVTLRNRIAIPPMCQYKAHDGLSAIGMKCITPVWLVAVQD